MANEIESTQPEDQLSAVQLPGRRGIITQAVEIVISGLRELARRMHSYSGSVENIRRQNKRKGSPRLG